MFYDIGSIVSYSTFMGSLRYVKVTQKDADMDGFSGILLDPLNYKPVPNTMNSPGSDKYEMVWGYDDQITEIVVGGES